MVDREGNPLRNKLVYLQGAQDEGRRKHAGCPQVSSANLPAALSSTTYNVNNQLTAWGSASLSYDLNGNMTSDGTTTHTWNARNQLSAYGSTSFSYDAFGRRIQNASGKAFLYDGRTAVQELSGSTVTANLLTGFGIDEIFTRTDSGGVRNFLTDSVGSAVALTDSSGTVQTQYSYEPFGKTTVSGASNANTFQFIDREDDSALYYYRARYYNPTFQRFISEDPLDFDGGDVDLYGYVGDDPTDLVDPSGEASFAGPLFGGGSGHGIGPGRYTGHGHRNRGGGGGNTVGGGGGARYDLCASNFAESISAAWALHRIPGLKAGFGEWAADVLGGNEISGLVDLYEGLRSGASGGHNVFYIMSQQILAGPSQGLGGLLGKDSPWTADIMALLLGEYASGIGEAKFIYSGVTFLEGIGVCRFGLVN